MLFVGADKPRCNIDTPTASRLNVRDDREAPLLIETGRRHTIIVSGKKKEEYF
jgi:hypothetical protein